MVVLSKAVPWYGNHTGYYKMLPEALVHLGTPMRLIRPRRGLRHRLLGKAWSWWRGLPRRDQTLAEAEWRFLRAYRTGGAPGVILAVEDFLPLLGLRDFAPKAPSRLTGVIHYPAAMWDADRLRLLGRLKSALVLYRCDLPFFERHVGAGRVRFVPHGVDVDYFRPGPGHIGGPPRLLSSGQFGRDFALLEEAFTRLSATIPGIRLDIVGAHHARERIEVRKLAARPTVTIHPQLGDEALLELYQTASLLVLPLRECGANNALVEALACGLPIVATAVGGVGDYGGGSLFPVVPPGDAGALAEAADSLLREPQRRRAIGVAGRNFAEHELTWTLSARRHLEAIEELAAA